MTAPLRERRRAAAVREILDAAQEQIALHGPAGLSLRSVARGLGMTVQALYHYFPSRDELITALIAEAYDDLADAVQAALDAAPAPAFIAPTFIAAAEGFRTWALDNSARFQLIYGTPLLHYRAPADGRTTAAAGRLAAVFIRELFGGFTEERLTRTEFPLSPALRAHLDLLPPGPIGALPPPAAALFIDIWGHLHGLVVLEVFGHTDFIGPLQAEIFRSAMHNLLADAHRRIPTRA